MNPAVQKNVVFGQLIRLRLFNAVDTHQHVVYVELVDYRNCDDRKFTVLRKFYS